MTKTTHTIHDVDALILEKVILLKTATGDDKKKLREQIKKLEKHFNDCNDKAINGHKYPERMKGFPDEKPMNVKELHRLIDDVRDNGEPSYIEFNNNDGIFVTDPNSKDYDKYWKTPKTMNPSPFFK